jgi:AraC-like DNA-binding protein
MPAKTRPNGKPMPRLADVFLDGANMSIPAKGEVRRIRFAASGDPIASLGPLAVRREHLLSGKDLGTYYNEDYFALHLVRRGRGVLVSDGHPYGLTRGDVYITPPHTVHGLRDMHHLEADGCYFQRHLFSRAEWKILQASPGFHQLFLPSRRRSNPVADEVRRGPFHKQCLHLPPELLAEAEAIIENIRQDLQRDEPLGDMMARHHFFCLLGLLARWHEEQNKASVKRKRASATRPDRYQATPLAETIRYCDENFHRPLSVPQLAARAHLSPDYFGRLFLATTGVPPATYIRNLRLDKAQQLLRTGAMPIARITKECGFCNHDVFTRAFQNAFGLTPRQYRMRFRGSGRVPAAKS